MRQYYACLIFLIALACPASAQEESTPPPVLPEDFCVELFDLEEPIFGSMEPVQQFLDMELEGKTLPIKLPRGYLEDMWDFTEGYTVPSHAFRVDIDTFDPIKSRDLRAFLDEHGQRSLNILINDVVDLPEVLKIAEDSGLRSAELFGGITKAYDSILDLTRIETKTPHPSHRILFIAETAGGTLTDVFSCRRPGDGVNQSCRHYFRTYGVDVYTRYDDQHLPSWQIIKSNVTTFLGCMLNNEEKSQ